MTKAGARRPSAGGRWRWRSAVDAVKRLVEEHGCALMKIATEDEALTHDDVRARFALFAPAIEIELKIGGPGARGDLALCRAIGIERVIAPMVESAYGLEDFLNGVSEIYRGVQKNPKLGVNIETGGAARGIRSLLAADEKRRLHQVTVGRGDLSKSLGAGPDDPRVMKLARAIVRCAHARGYVTSVGGGIHPANVVSVARGLAPEYVNTRNFAFRLDGSSGDAAITAAVRAALEAEIAICRADGGALALKRAKDLEARMTREGR